jgi:hypothetical protein
MLNIGFTYLARYDNRGQRLEDWVLSHAQVSVGIHRSACDRVAWPVRMRVAQSAQWGPSVGDQVARQITVDAFTDLLAILVPVPGGGFIVATAERWAVQEAAGVLADKLEAAIEDIFGMQWAPWLAAGIGAGVLAIVAIAASKQSG